MWGYQDALPAMVASGHFGCCRLLRRCAHREGGQMLPAASVLRHVDRAAEDDVWHGTAIMQHMIH